MKTLRLCFVLLASASGAFAQEPDAAKLALAHDVIAASQMDKMFDSLNTQMKQMASQMMQMPADTSPEKRAMAEKFIGKVMELSMGAAKDMMGKFDQLYATVYTEQELQAMLAFFRSPEGQSMLAKQPQIMSQLMPLVQQMQRELMPKIQQLAQEAKAEAEALAAPPAAK